MLLFKQITFQTSLSRLTLLFFSRVTSLFSWAKKKNVLSSLDSVQCLPTVSAAKSHGDWMPAAQFTAFLLSISRQGKEWNSFAYLLLAAQLQQ